jgi:hypothetical protein
VVYRVDGDVAPGNVQTPARKIVFVFRDGFGNFYTLLFDGANLEVYGGGNGWGPAATVAAAARLPLRLSICLVPRRPHSR